MDITNVTHLRETPLRNPKFILDVHLGKLAKYLRMLGFDTLYETDYTDFHIVDIATAQNRTILTRDVSILKIKSVTHGYWIRSQNPFKQLVEVIRRFDLTMTIKPFSRCTSCNGSMEKVTKESVMDRLEPKTKQYYEEFYQCESCKKVYWKGSHYENMKKFIETLRSSISNAGQTGKEL
jgi:uncharacterized protein with PIN domain